MTTCGDDHVADSDSGQRFSRRAAVRGLGGAGLALAGSSALPGASTAAPAAASQNPEQPNILVLMVDQMRDWQWFPDQEVRDQAFPNLARLQDGAVRFGQHRTVSAMCTPSRGSLLTGLYSHQTGLVLTLGSNTTNLQGAIPNPGANAATPPPASPAAEAAPPYPPLDPRFPTWGTLMRQQGYETYWYGKTHINDEICDVEQYGFSGGTCPSPNGKPGGGLVEDPKVADQAIDWLQDQGDQGPWCTTVSFVNPHDIMWYPRFTRHVDGESDPPSVFDELPPNYENAADLARQQKPHLQLASYMAEIQIAGEIPHRGPDFEQGWIEMLDLYYQLHSYVDQEIGRVLDALEAQPEVAENTIIIFTSDHGEYCGSHGMRGKGAGLYEEGIRVPLWVKDPTGQFADQPEVERTQLTSSVDFMPMLLTMANGGDSWREQPELAYLANRHDMTTLLQDANAPGRDYVLHATDEDGYENGPILLPFMEDAPFHVLGLVTEDAKLGVYTHWADDSDEILTEDQQVEFYDYSTEEGRLELANTAGPDNQRFAELHQKLMTEAVPNELRATLPDELEAARQETMAATVARIAYDKSIS